MHCLGNGRCAVSCDGSPGSQRGRDGGCSSNSAPEIFPVGYRGEEESTAEKLNRASMYQSAIDYHI